MYVWVCVNAREIPPGRRICLWLDKRPTLVAASCSELWVSAELNMQMLTPMGKGMATTVDHVTWGNLGEGEAEAGSCCVLQIWGGNLGYFAMEWSETNNWICSDSLIQSQVKLYSLDLSKFREFHKNFEQSVNYSQFFVEYIWGHTWAQRPIIRQRFFSWFYYPKCILSEVFGWSSLEVYILSNTA